ncbi:WGR domain-containing protein [Umezawaea endophytica]|uniref:WGR domain-containing protein n=1 Tax=Umezawaea endophytica TaxID=1654476 RepID=A0A9X2VTN9_9PSEU|nr:WGR domain-containing protein [Umezawaea endophytica]MCS7481929.1 WGR domain-containing protein [Umezawaea endophytica]
MGGERDGAGVTVRYGRLRLVGQTKVKGFGSETLAHVDKLVAEKEKKGLDSVSTSEVLADLTSLTG